MYHAITIDNVKTYGNATGGVGFVYRVDNPDGVCDDINIFNSVNNINGVNTGFIGNIYGGFTINFENVVNNGEISSSGFSGGMIGYAMNIDNTNFKNVANKGNIVCTEDDETLYVGGIVGDLTSTNTIVDNAYNTGNIINCDSKVGGLFGEFRVYDGTINNSFNSGNITNAQAASIGGLVGYESIMTKLAVKKSFNTGNIQTEGYGRLGGLLGETEFHGDTLIEDCYNTGDIITTAPVVGGLVADIDGLIKNSYNKGKITASTSWGYVGGLVATGDYSYRYVDVENSYNEGEIILNSDGTGVWLGGICGICGDVKNSYNKGNITSKNYDKYIGGITGRGKTVSNSYNFGNITITNGGLRTSESDEKVSYSGIMVDGDAITNSYNLGNISLNDDGTNFPTILAAGIGIGDFPVSNSVNSGNIKLNVNNKYTGPHTIGLYGTTPSSDSTNNYNLGLVELDDSALDDPISEDGFNGEHHIITISNAINDSVPDILSIINGDDAFEIKEGETLPTLKAFN
jgi:hypothetical protein